MIPGVLQEGRRLFTPNLVKGVSVYGEQLLQRRGREYREWVPGRSKLAAALLKGMDGLVLKPDSTVLYLGAATGTTVSYLSDLLTKGLVFALEFSPEVFAGLYMLASQRPNLIPLLADASQPEEYYHRLGAVEFLYQDIAQRNQVDIFIRNAQLFLRKGGQGFLCIKARSIDVAKKPKQVFADVREVLKNHFNIEDYRTLHPFQKDHAAFLVRKR